MTAKEYFKDWIDEGDWVTFKIIDKDKNETYLEEGTITFPFDDDEDQETVFIWSDEIVGFDEDDGGAVHRDLIEDRLGDRRWKEEQERAEGEEYRRAQREGWEYYRSR
jgi:hypothetical protein